MTAAAFILRRGILLPETADERGRRVRRRVGVAVGLLVLNALTFAPGVSILHIPYRLGQAITQAALPLAIIVILTVNRRVRVRPNVFLCLVSLLVLDTIVACLQTHYFGTLYRTFRLAEFIAALWLLTPWWGRRDLLLLRCYLTTLLVVLGSVLLGLLVAPGRAFISGRLNGVLWPIPDTQVGHYAAVVIGMVIVSWLGGLVRGRVALLVSVVAGAILVLTHTRTAPVAMITGIVVAGLSLFAAKSRARKFFATASVVVSIAIIALGSVLTSWWTRGQSPELLATLTGRTKYWTIVLNFPRNKFEEIFGFGMTNGGFNGVPIDNNWIESYTQQGLIGVAVCVAILLLLLITAFFQARGVRRALALFFVTYCILASITEVGFTDATTYLIELMLAASLLMPPAARARWELLM